MMKSVDDAKGIYRAQQVKNYFRDVVRGNRDDAHLDPVFPNYGYYGNIGLVWGSAFWQDSSATAKTAIPNLAYSFAFERDANGNWLILLLWGRCDDGGGDSPTQVPPKEGVKSTYCALAVPRFIPVIQIK
jgi:hypothetical protein